MKQEVIAASDMTRKPGPDLAPYDFLLLAEGDSWFTIGSLNLPKVSNLLFESVFTKAVGIISSARPGDTLQHMVDSVHDPYFDRLLRNRRFARPWAGILLSSGGNDLIDALQVGPVAGQGRPRPLKDRLLLTTEEAKAVHPTRGGIDRHVSEEGWATLAGYLRANLRLLVERKAEGPNAERPLLTHTYVPPTVRTSKGGSREKRWLFPAMQAYGIPASDAQGLSDLFFSRLRALLLESDGQSGSVHALPTVHVLDFTGKVKLDPANSDDAGNAGDWVNEIHPNRGGFRKLGAVFGPWVQQALVVSPR